MDTIVESDFAGPADIDNAELATLEEIFRTHLVHRAQRYRFFHGHDTTDYKAIVMCVHDLYVIGLEEFADEEVLDDFLHREARKLVPPDGKSIRYIDTH